MSVHLAHFLGLDHQKSYRIKCLQNGQPILSFMDLHTQQPCLLEEIDDDRISPVACPGGDPENDEGGNGEDNRGDNSDPGGNPGSGNAQNPENSNTQQGPQLDDTNYDAGDFEDNQHSSLPLESSV